MAISVLPPKLTLEQTAKLKKLESRLCIPDIAALRYPKDKALCDAYAFIIAEACLLGDLEYHHHIKRHDVRWLCENPGEESIMGWVPISDNDVIRTITTPDTRLAQHRRFYANNNNADEFELLKYDYATGRRFSIDSNEFTRWLIAQNDYPIVDDCLLPNWFESALIAEKYLRANWPESLPQAEPVGDAVEVSQEDIKHQRTGINGERDKDAAAWLAEVQKDKSDFDLDAWTVTQIKGALKSRDITRDKKLWARGFADWNRGQQVWPKKKAGKKSGK